MMDKPFAPACEENKTPIFEVIAPRLSNARSVLEIGSCTGQHAVHFAPRLPHLTWQCSDVAQYLPGMQLWLDDCAAPNLPAPLVLDVDGDWPPGPYDAVFSANTAHIMSLVQVERMFAGAGRVLADGGLFLLYGPFSDHGRHTSDSNAAFDRSLRLRDPLSGVRDLDELTRFADATGLRLVDDVAMPVNNRTLIWRKG
jgi:hypothetical protein